MGKQSGPKIPDPEKVAKAQTKSNIDTAIAQTELNSQDQHSAFGDVKYEIVGKNPDGTPKYAVSQTFSPELKAAFDRANGAIAAPLDLSSAGLDAFTNTHFVDDFNQQNDRNRTALETRLAEQGIVPGSEAYKRAMEDFGVTSGKAFDNFLGDQQANAKDLMLTSRNQPLNEFLSLSGRGSTINTPQTGVAGTDVAGIQQAGYNAQNAQYLNSQQQTNSILGGLFGLGSSALMAFSDEELKEDIHDTGEEIADVPIKTFNWKSTGEPDVGVIAQDVQKKYPHLVEMDKSGYRKVNYGALALADAVRKHGRAA